MPGPRWPHVADCPSSENEPIVSGGSRMSTFVRCAIPGHARSSRRRASSPALGGALDLTGTGIVTFEQPPLHVPPFSRMPSARPRLAGFSSNGTLEVPHKRSAKLGSVQEAGFL